MGHRRGDGLKQIHGLSQALFGQQCKSSNSPLGEVLLADYEENGRAFP